MEDEFKVKMA
jgi:hypothetical protein